MEPAPLHALLPDPWCTWPGGLPYAVMAEAGVGFHSSHAAVRDAFFDLMERGLVDDQVRAAYNQLKIIPRRLLVDSLMYDDQAAADLLALLNALPQAKIDETPLSEAIPFSWGI
jgi:hypothetical protein